MIVALESLAAWLLLPALVVAVSLGIALLLERVSGWRHPPLRVPIGLCGAICLCLAVYELGATGPVALVVLVIAALGGLIAGRCELAGLRPGWLTAAWVGAYLLHLAPVLLTGEWTWTGYNFVNDTSVQLLLADHLATHGAAMPDVALPNTATEHVRVYFESAYPLGTHALLGTLAEAVRVPLPALYQPLIALVAATTAVALASLARRVGLPAALAAGAGLAAVAANLYYQYGLQGNLKEVGFLMSLAAAAAAARELLSAESPPRAAPAVAVCFASAFAVYSAAAAPYLLALGAAVAAAGLFHANRAGYRPLLLAGAALLCLAMLFALPALLNAVQFNRVASGTFASAERAADLGHLLRPLELIQTAGIWLAGEYRAPIDGFRSGLTTVLSVFVGLLAAAGLIAALRRREAGLPVLIVATGVSALYLLPRLSPYADGKVIALASPVVVLSAFVGAWSLAAVRRSLAMGAAGLAAVAILWSDAFAYHAVKLAPVERLQALDELSGRYRGAGELVMLNEPEELAKNFTGGAPINVATEAITPKQVQLRNPQGFAARYFDLDEHALRYVEQFPVIIKRRSPAASRPPVGYRLDHANGWYEAWVRRGKTRIVEHLPLGDQQHRGARPRCADVTRLASIARPGETLVGASVPGEVRLDPLRSRRSFGGGPHSFLPGMVVTETPGETVTRVRVARPGRFRAWVAGSFGRDIDVEIDRRRVGTVKGVNNLGQWHPAGVVTVGPGSHLLRLYRGGGGFAPGDGYKGELGPLVLTRREPTALVRVHPSEARRLCSRAWDWIELVAGPVRRG